MLPQHVAGWPPGPPMNRSVEHQRRPGALGDLFASRSASLGEILAAWRKWQRWFPQEEGDRPVAAAAPRGALYRRHRRWGRRRPLHPRRAARHRRPEGRPGRGPATLPHPDPSGTGVVSEVPRKVKARRLEGFGFV